MGRGNIDSIDEPRHPESYNRRMSNLRLTPLDCCVLKICALAVHRYPIEAYQRMISACHQDEIDALLRMFSVESTTVEGLARLTFARDWSPQLKEREHLLASTDLVRLLEDLRVTIDGPTAEIITTAAGVA